MIVTYEELAAQAGLTLDAPAEDQTLLQQKADAAQNHVERLLGFKIEDMFGGVDQDPIPAALKEAVLQLACWWFENRETVETRDEMLPFGVSEIVTEYREWTF